MPQQDTAEQLLESQRRCRNPRGHWWGHLRRWGSRTTCPQALPDEMASACTEGTVALADLQAGQRAIVVQLYGGHALAGRLAALGFTPGVSLSMVRNSGHGPVIVSVLDTQVALGFGQARHVAVRRCDGDEETLE